MLDPTAKDQIVKACHELGFFKVVNHGVPLEAVTKLEEEVVKFFNLPQLEKEKVGSPNPFGYGHKKIGTTGDVGWVEYLLLSTHNSITIPGNSQLFRCLMEDYVGAVRNTACEVLEMIAEGLKVLSNGRFKSVKHRVLVNSMERRLSMIFFGGPALSEKIAPLSCVMEEGEESIYNEFTWGEYINSLYKSKMGANKLLPFQKNA
nr:gibberellin 2-beta-dioxygenase 1-like [Ipomoea trifida]